MGVTKVWSDNWVSEAAAVVASTSAAGFPVSNLSDGKRFKKWRSTSDSSQYIEFDLGFPSTPKAFAAISDRNNPLKITPSATIKLQGNSTNTWTTPEFEVAIPFRDYVLAVENAFGLHTSPLRYWRLFIDDPTNPYGYVELGEVFLGDYVELVRGCSVYPFTSRVSDSSSVFVSEGGQRYGYKKSLGQEFQVEWRGLVKADVEELEDIFNYYGTNTPFFMSFDSAGAFSTEKETWVRFVRFKDSTDIQLSSFNNFGATYQLSEEF